MVDVVQYPDWSCTVVDDGHAAVVRLRGELDLATGDRFREAVYAAIWGGGPVVVDLAQLTFVDSTGLRCLMTVAAGAQQAEVTLEFLPGAATAMRLFEPTRTLEALPFRSAA